MHRNALKQKVSGALFALLLLFSVAKATQAQTANGYIIFCNDYSLFLALDASNAALTLCSNHTI